MGTFAETVNVVYRLSFADQGRQISVFHFQFAENNWKFPIFAFCLQQTNGSCRFLLVPFCL
jgi:hypothetical protein